MCVIDGTRDGVWRECRSERSHCWLLVIFSLSDGGPVHLLSHPICHHSPAGVAPPLGLSPSGLQRSGCPETGGSTLRLRSAQLPLLGRTPSFLTSVASGEGVGSDVSMGRWEGREGRAAGEEVAGGSPALRHASLLLRPRNKGARYFLTVEGPCVHGEPRVDSRSPLASRQPLAAACHLVRWGLYC